MRYLINAGRHGIWCLDEDADEGFDWEWIIEQLEECDAEYSFEVYNTIH